MALLRRWRTFLPLQRLTSRPVAMALSYAMWRRALPRLLSKKNAAIHATAIPPASHMIPVCHIGRPRRTTGTISAERLRRSSALRESTEVSIQIATILFGRLLAPHPCGLAGGIEDERRQVFARRRARPPDTVAASLRPRREAIQIEVRPHRRRRLAGERIVPEKPQRRPVALEELDQKHDQPWVVERRLHRREPHQPVETQVVGRELARHRPGVAGLA